MSYGREIKPSTSTEFPIGTKVKITNSGHCYSGYKDMADYLGLSMKFPNNPFRTGDVGHVIGKAQHGQESNGDVIAVRIGALGNTNGPIGLMSHRGLTIVEPEVVIGKPKLPNYELAPLTPDAYDALELRVMNAPSWATHIGSDYCGVHYFDHHPHIFVGGRLERAFVKGLLPDTHRCKAANDQIGATSGLKVMVIKRPLVAEPTVEELKRELAAVKAKLWEAEQKLKKIAEVAA